jgi:putative membrane protein
MENKVLGFSFTRIQIATFIAILFHVIGLIGILFFDKTIFVQTTSLNLLLMFLLILFTQNTINKSFLFFIVCCFATGILVEIIGTKTGILFGNYSYGTVLGPTFMNVPYIIGLNWFMIIYCAGISMNILLHKMVDQINTITNNKKPIIKLISLVIDGATLALFFDWIMEPIAIKLGYWKWGGNGAVPFFNYVCWFLVSLFLLFIFHQLKFDKRNKFALHLLMIQVMFFLLLRTLI